MSGPQPPLGAGAAKPRPALEHLNRLFGWMALSGLILMVAGVLGLVFLPSGEQALGAAAIGVGFTTGFGGLHGRRSYRKMIARLDAADGRT